MNLLKSSTVTQIVRVKDSEMLPAVGELTTADEEQFPIFDADVLVLAKTAACSHASVLLRLNRGAGTPRGYVRGLFAIDITAQTLPCPDCTTWEAWNTARGFETPSTYSRIMSREPASATNGGVDQFVCPSCSRRIYLAPVKATEVQLPPVARARVNRITDGIFALDHLQHTATLTDTCDDTVPNLPPWDGIHAELEPFSETFVLDGLDMVPYRRKRQPGEQLKTVTAEPLKLRLRGRPFEGRVVYEVL